MNIKYKCVCSHKKFVRGNDYEVNKHDLISPYNKSSAGSVYLYENTDIVFLKTKDDGKMLFIENDIIVLIRQDIWRERLINKLLENDI